ncbi:hypothetical protein [Macrococcus carouselicus]|uniref:Uncharacterized protein n=1 Tax=Macrococcus carouselicus TaxID=69969 RepID=A0A9Q8CFC8_9STAP|nr:hypothetical protein [Macrococcus carouselicus]TDM02290.1 hypothetical protein ERX40_06975 [Macrococcus carouselicus]
MKPVLAYYLLHTIQLHHREPLTYEQLKNLTVNPLSEIEEQHFDAEIARLKQEKLITLDSAITLTFTGEAVLQQHKADLKFNEED